MTIISHSRDFDAPWPVVLAEMKDFVDLVRLHATGRSYRRMTVRVRLSQTALARQGIPEAGLQPWFGEFRALMAALRDCQFEPIATEEPTHKINIFVEI